jgi:glyoxylase-like metal-dependent hydrolase (beta-lactamase superfamily II)
LHRRVPDNGRRLIELTIPHNRTKVFHMTLQPTQQIPGIYHRKIGDIVVTAVSDGYLDGNLEVMRNVDLEKAHQILRNAFRPARRTSVNTFLIHSKGRMAIVDTGSGNYLQPSAGFVQRNLAAAGIDPNSIDTVFLTHMHPDHSAGLTDMSTGRRLFPNAELVMHENELAHWFDDGAMAKVDERSRKLYFLAGREQVAPYNSRTRLFTQGEVFPGVTAVPSLGHTPGHTAYLIASGNDQLMIWGDTVHVPEVQTAFPEAGMAFDTDLAAAAASRKRMFDRVATDGVLIAGMHLHFPAFSRLARRGDGYLIFPEPWVHALDAI